jgi:Flp pilus assembly protein TadD
MRTPRLALAAALMVALAVTFAAAGCSKSAPARSPSADAFRRSQALIDSGNVAYRAHDFEGAARRYASAAVARPEDPAAFYGLGMALAKLGRDDEARVAYAKARALSGAAEDSALHH